MNKREAKKLCKEVIADIELLQTTNMARMVVDGISFIHLCHFKNVLQEYVDSDTFPKEIDFPAYDLSALDNHPLVSIEFKRLHKEKSEEAILLTDEVYQALLGEQ